MTISYEFGDIQHYKKSYESFVVPLQSKSFFEFVDLLLTNESAKIEFFIPFIVYIVSFFNENMSYAYAFTSIFYYLVWATLILNLIKDADSVGGKIPSKLVLLLVFFATYIIFFRAINGRFYLAYWFAITASYFIFFKQNRKYYLLLLFCLFIHQTFAFLFFLIVFFDLIKKYISRKGLDFYLIILILIVSSLSELSISFVNENISVFTPNLQENYQDYVKDSYVEGQMSRDRAWFVELRTPILFYISFIFLVILRYSKRIHLTNFNYLYFKFLLIFSLINSFTYAIPSFGPRFRNVLIGFILLGLFKILNENRQARFSVYYCAFFIAIIYHNLVSLRVFAEYINLYSYFPMPLVFDALDNDDFSLFDLIGG